MAPSRSPPPLRGLLELVIYLSSFALCLVGAAGVLTIIGVIVAADLALGIAKGDFRTRLHRPRW